MPGFDLVTAVGIVGPRDDERGISGTCFRYRHSDVVLTAAHCVPEGPEYLVEFPGERWPVVDVVRHRTADLAVLRTPHDGGPRRKHQPGVFWGHVGNYSLGEQLFAFGYPVEGPWSALGRPVPRLFTANYQRFFEFDSPHGYHYRAGELSIPAPAGLSGGPAFRPGAHPMLTGVVTANLESYAIIDSVEESNADGSTTRHESRRVISYGLAAMLDDVAGWLEDNVPAFDD